MSNTELRIYNAIMDSPGINISSLCDETHIFFMTLLHLLEKMQADGHIVIVDDVADCGAWKCYTTVD